MRKLSLIVSLILLVNKGVLFGQTITQYYDVIHNDQVVGTTVVNKTGDDKNFIINLKMTANISLFIKKAVILGKENAIFENGVLKSGYVFRKVNDKVKTDNWVKFNNNKYTQNDGTTLSYLSAGEIRNNMLSLFFSEPLNVKKIYSDNQQKFVEIKLSSSGAYTFPGKNESLTTFIYKDGYCSRIILKSSLITLTFKRK